MAEKKVVKAFFKQNVYSDIGAFKKDKCADIPEDRFLAWEKSGLCEKQKEDKKEDKKE